MPAKNTTKAKATKNTKKTSAPKKVVVETPVVETPVVETPVVETHEEDTGYDQEFMELQTNLKGAINLIKGLVTHVNKLEKRLNRDKRVLEKKLKTKPRRASNGLNGFSKPGPISDELAKFLGLTKGDLVARTEVTKKITAYCKAHDLQKKEDKRQIVADAPLRKLLRLEKTDELTFFNLQKYMKVHYPNKEGVYPTA